MFVHLQARYTFFSFFFIQKQHVYVYVCDFGSYTSVVEGTLVRLDTKRLEIGIPPTEPLLLRKPYSPPPHPKSEDPNNRHQTFSNFPIHSSTSQPSFLRFPRRCRAIKISNVSSANNATAVIEKKSACQEALSSSSQRIERDGLSTHKSCWAKRKRI